MGAFALVVGLVIVWISFIQLPDFSSFDSRKVVESTKIYDRTGEVVLYDLNSDVKRTRIPYTEMGINIKNATVAIEDAEFYNHHGFRPKAFLRAVLVNLRLKSGIIGQGGSTITQQVIKKSLLSDEKTIVRKLKEIVLALKLERQYTKDEILGIYLNEIPYGGSIYGIAEASRVFFGKQSADLSLAEAAYLASIPNAPTRYSPYGTHKDLLEQRKNLVLSREKELGFITEAEYEQARSEVVEWKPQESSDIKAPHFVFFIKDYLEEKYGAEVVESGGLKVVTTLDYDMQKSAEEAVYEYTLGDKKQIEYENAGLIAIDPKTGQILSMVGSRNYFDTDIDGNFNVTTARRQPGSSFKPYMYATALKRGFTPETVLFDVPTEFNSGCNPYHSAYPGVNQANCYMPKNYDGKYHGPMTIREALARSMNVPAVKMLYIVGVKNAIKTAEDMGITTLTDPDRYGLALVLGGGEVRLLEMVSAYSGFAGNGTKRPYTGILSVTDKTGNTLESWEDRPIEVLPRNTALQMNSILSDNEARTPTFGARSALYFPDREVAVKTGTTNDFKDSWTVGYTPSLAAGVWIGKNDNTSMPQAVSAAPLWHMFMQNVLQKYPNEQFERPIPDPNYETLPPMLRGFFQGGESFIIDSLSGGLATKYTPKETQVEKVITNVHSILYWVDRQNPTSEQPKDPSKDSLFNNFETAVQDWWNQNKLNYPQTTSSNKPTFYDTLHTEATALKINILNPKQGSVFSARDQVTVMALSGTNYPLQKIDIFVNNTYVGTKSGSSPIFTFSLNDVSSVTPGENKITVTGTDSIYNSSSAEVNIQVQ